MLSVLTVFPSSLACTVNAFNGRCATSTLCFREQNADVFPLFLCVFTPEPRFDRWTARELSVRCARNAGCHAMLRLSKPEPFHV